MLFFSFPNMFRLRRHSTWIQSLEHSDTHLVVLDDVWSLPVLERLIFKVPGCKIFVVSCIMFPPSF
ncbi:hypothetical protein Hanom_Chr17g01580551 [Helianthus anomalus]